MIQNTLIYFYTDCQNILMYNRYLLIRIFFFGQDYKLKSYYSLQKTNILRKYKKGLQVCVRKWSWMRDIRFKIWSWFRQWKKKKRV